MKLTTAGESHGKALLAIVEGLPAHLKIDKAKINGALALRQSGFGRGARQKIEKDEAEILSGVRGGETLGSPLALCIRNRDYESWKAYMSDGECDLSSRAVTRVRPGHADLSGMLKYGQSDARNILERASARETAIRVAAGEIFRQYLSALGVEIAGYVREVCGVKDGGRYAFNELAASKKTGLGMIDPEAERAAEEKVSALKSAGDTAGGVVEVRVRGLKSGFGSCMTYADKLDARLAGALMGIQAAKGVEVGIGFEAGSLSGKEVHDEIFYEGGFRRRTNRAGGIEGGMSNGEEIVLRAAMKPIPTLMKGLKTADFLTHEEAVAASERSDVCAIFAFEIIAEAAAAEVIACAVAERLGGDTMAEAVERYARLP